MTAYRLLMVQPDGYAHAGALTELIETLRYGLQRLGKDVSYTDHNQIKSRVNALSQRRKVTRLARRGSTHRADRYSVTTDMPRILACHSRGPVSCTDVPFASTATVTGMSLTSNS